MARTSTIKRLPKDLKDRLDAALRDGAVTQLEITQWLNGRLAERGKSPVSKSAVNRYALRFEEVGRKLRESREVAQQFVARLGAEPEGDVGRLVIEIVRTLAFDLATKTAEEDGGASSGLLVDLSEAVRNLEMAAARSAARELVVKRELKKEIGKALDDVEKGARGQKAPLSAETLKEIRERIYGIVG